ncbi:uncharacterized protein LOC133784566 [Humulus lupulus]|uniref:uncharacterized protein LOC133784566 n=1 Tax=Humulus lupulus TaxID=3486 RepID=UPI002B410981|nr:uncharacterized protein LOC133784566 [Humulus lupulus]
MYQRPRVEGLDRNILFSSILEDESVRASITVKKSSTSDEFVDKSTGRLGFKEDTTYTRTSTEKYDNRYEGYEFEAKLKLKLKHVDSDDGDHDHDYGDADAHDIGGHDDDDDDDVGCDHGGHFDGDDYGGDYGGDDDDCY